MTEFAVGIDIGGAFNDAVALDFKTGKKKNIAKSDNETQTTNKTKDKNDASKASS